MRSGRAALGAAAIAVAALIASPPATATAQDADWTSFPGGIAPGATIAQIGADDYSTCTLGVIAGDPTTHRLYALTAGHCDHSDTKEDTVLYTESNSPDIARPLGTYIASRDTDGDTAGRGNDLPLYTDAGVIEIQDRTPIASFKIAGLYPVRSVVTDRADLPYGTEVCKYGMRTGETCGPIQVASKYTITAELRAIKGDSGAPLYRKNTDGSVDIIGLLSAGDDQDNKFFWIAPLLQALNLQVCGCAPN